jgi:hypothetical protein
MLLLLVISLYSTLATNWYYRPSLFSSHVAPWGDGTSYASAWKGGAKHIDWHLIKSGDTLFVCGVGSGIFEPPAGLNSVVIDGNCPTGNGFVDRGTLVGGSALLFGPDQNSTVWTPLPNGIFRATGVVTGESAAKYAVAILAAPKGSSRSVKLQRLGRANCTLSGPVDTWDSTTGAFCVATTGGLATPPGPVTVYFLPPRQTTATLSVQLQAGEFTIRLLNTTGVAMRHLDVYGPAARVLDISGGRRLEVSNCSFAWGSYAGVVLNYKSAPNGGLNVGTLVDNSIYQSGNGIYYVNQANQGEDDSANSNDVLFARNILRDIDTENVYGNRDTGAVEIQGGLRNVFEHNVIDGAGGSGFTFYQGSRQTMGNTVVRYNLVQNIKSRDPRRNMRGIEFCDDNLLNNSYRLGNNTVYYNVIINVTHAGLRSKAVSTGSGADACSWRWDNNLVLDVGAGFEIKEGGHQYANHGDCVFNNIFACSISSGCRANYTHVKGWVPPDVALDSDVHASNTYWPDGALFCSSSGVGCYDLPGWQNVSGGSFGSHSLVADPLFTSNDPSSWPQGLRPTANSPVRRAGRAILQDFGAVHDFSGMPVELVTPDIGPYRAT